MRDPNLKTPHKENPLVELVSAEEMNDGCHIDPAYLPFTAKELKEDIEKNGIPGTMTGMEVKKFH